MALPTSAPKGLPFPPKKQTEVKETQAKEAATSLPTLPSLVNAPSPATPRNTEEVNSPLRDDIEVAEVKNYDARGEWEIDSKTGIRHRVMPKSKYDAEGNPILQIPDFDIDDLNSEANEFLAHLRVTPSKEEQQLAQQERARARQGS